MKNLLIGLLSVLIIFWGMLYLVSITVPVEAEKETEKNYDIILDAVIERDENREERIELRRIIDESLQKIKELEKRADELNIVINGEEGL